MEQVVLAMGGKDLEILKDDWPSFFSDHASFSGVVDKQATVKMIEHIHKELL